MSQRRTFKNNKKWTASASGEATSPAIDTLLQTLSEMFPDWEAEDLASLLSEHINDVEIVIDLIVKNKVSKWEPTKKESRNKRRDGTPKSGEHPHSSPASAGAASSSAGSSSQTPAQGDGKNKHLSERQHKPERRREKKSQTGHKKDLATTSGTAAPAPLSAGSAASAGASSVNTTSAATTLTSSTAAGVPSNSWASVLSKDSAKPKSTQTAKVQEDLDDAAEEPVSNPAQQADVNAAAASAVVEQNSESVAEVAPSQLPKTQSSNVQPSKSWASAIKPKANPASRKAPRKSDSAQASRRIQEASQNANSDNTVQEEAIAVPKITEQTVAHTAIALEAQHQQHQDQRQQQQPQPELISIPVMESEVVLPQHVNTVGVSFGSLSMNDNRQLQSVAVEEQNKEASHGISFGTSQQPVNVAHQNELAQQAQQLQQSQVHSKQDTINEHQQHHQQTQQEVQQHQSDQQTYQHQQYDQSRKGTSSQWYDYYSQFRQTQQQFPQLAAAGSIPAQFAYPSFDYSAYGQVNQSALGSPGYYQVNTANANLKSNSNANASGTADISQSPFVTNAAQQGLQNPQQSQQVPGAPFAYPNCYNYFYSTPFYGNAAGMGASNTAYGMQQGQQQPQAQQGNEGAVPTENESTSGQSNAQGAQAANPVYSAQYYGNPNQVGSRGGYPYNGYPSSQPHPQGGQAGEQPEAQQNGQQQGIPQQATPAPSGASQYHQQMPQYTGYQQFPQYGTYQDSSQYRAWY